MDLKKLEISLLTQTYKCLDNVPENLKESVKWFIEGQYGEILRSDVGHEILGTIAAENQQDLSIILKQNVDRHFDNSEENNLPLREFELLIVAASCLQLFVQNNWLGPSPSNTAPKSLLHESLTVEVGDQTLKHSVESELSIDGEPVYNLAVHLEYLCMARRLLLECRGQCRHLQTVEWWLMRCTCILQQILDDKSNTLREAAIELIDHASKKEPLMTDEANRDIQIEFHLEAAYLCHMYYCYREARNHIKTARKLAALDVQLTGAMGKRTRFQQEDKAQLVLQVTRGTSDGNHGYSMEAQTVENKQMPKNLCLEDDTVLDSISFTDEERVHSDQVSATEQALILGIMEDYRRSRASEDKLTEEEVLAHITFVLDHASSWSVSVSALLLRSKLERGSRRRVERAMMQLEELYKQTKREAPSAGQRLRHFYCVYMVPVWNLQKQLAEILLSLGAVGAALEIYEGLEMWEDAISCYQRMGKTEKAETVIREQLVVKETPNLWCFLGDVTRKLEHYEKAWELSNHRSARAQRCMGYLYFGTEEYKKSLDCFEKSLQVNALQVPVWFTYGCAAMAAEDFKLAVKAFKRCTSIDYDNFEAWSNLATAYIKLKEKTKAFKTLNDAIKCNYENWKIWENYLIVATDCGEFHQVIRAYHMLIDLREKWVDEGVLGVLVKAVMENLPDANQRPAASIKPQLKELFGRITAKVTDNAEVWRLYAQLSGGVDGDTDKALQYLQKAHRSTMQTANWEKELDKCQEVSNHSLQLADSYVSASETVTNPTEAVQMLSSAKLMLRGVLSKIKQQHTDPVTQQIVADSVVQMCDDLDTKMQEIVEKINTLKAS